MKAVSHLDSNPKQQLTLLQSHILHVISAVHVHDVSLQRRVTQDQYNQIDCIILILRLGLENFMYFRSALIKIGLNTGKTEPLLD